ncbi:hypothetical protein [Deinococcus ruber]|uniref:Uncharacterized protein n=1 Tax=Deinococcus ruber TaxID=1848197 RepID=A0A918C9Z0_9DEIO|nr:hypothetical protein [Deinococcus ruber]GGR10895.1 hypothetical protein GCM10008957_24560 [Deinococcus ruber]
MYEMTIKELVERVAEATQQLNIPLTDDLEQDTEQRADDRRVIWMLFEKAEIGVAAAPTETATHRAAKWGQRLARAQRA